MVYVTQQETGFRLVNDQPEVAAHSHRPEVLVFGPVEFVQLHSGVDRIHLQIEGGGLDGFLFFASQSGEAIGKGIGNAEFHRFT
jgi:hypothetical protein